MFTPDRTGHASRDLSQCCKGQPPLTGCLLSFPSPPSGQQAVPNSPGLLPRGKIRAHLIEEFLNFSLIYETIDNTRIEVKKLCFLFYFSATMRRTAAYDHYILISGRIWVGSGSISLKGTMLTSALVPVLTSAVQTPPTAR